MAKESLIAMRDRALDGLPLFGKRRHDAADAIYDLYDEALRVRAASDRYREALECIYKQGRGPHVAIARDALNG